MKKHLNTLLIAAMMSMVSAAAFAQTYVPQVIGAMRVWRANVTSTSTPNGVLINESSARPVVIVVRGSTTASATITNELADGTVLNSQSVAIGTTPTSTSFPVPLYFEVVRVSATTALGSGAVSVTVIQ